MTNTVQTKATATYQSVSMPDDGLEQTFNRDGSGNVISITVTYQGKTRTNPPTQTDIVYTQTFTRNEAGQVTLISQWMPPS